MSKLNSLQVQGHHIQPQTGLDVLGLRLNEHTVRNKPDIDIHSGMAAFVPLHHLPPNVSAPAKAPKLDINLCGAARLAAELGHGELVEFGNGDTLKLCRALASEIPAEYIEEHRLNVLDQLMLGATRFFRAHKCKRVARHRSLHFCQSSDSKSLATTDTKPVADQVPVPLNVQVVKPVFATYKEPRNEIGEVLGGRSRISRPTSALPDSTGTVLEMIPDSTQPKSPKKKQSKKKGCKEDANLHVEDTAGTKEAISRSADKEAKKKRKVREGEDLETRKDKKRKKQQHHDSEHADTEDIIATDPAEAPIEKASVKASHPASPPEQKDAAFKCSQSPVLMPDQLEEFRKSKAQRFAQDCRQRPRSQPGSDLFSSDDRTGPFASSLPLWNPKISDGTKANPAIVDSDHDSGYRRASTHASHPALTGSLSSSQSAALPSRPKPKVDLSQ